MLPLCVAVAGFVGATAWPSATFADGSGTKGHCAAIGTGIKPSGELVFGPEQCFATLDEAKAYLQPSLARSAGSSAALSSLTTFYDPPSFSGTSFSVSFACASGYLNFANFGYPSGGTWDNRTSALITSCSFVSLYANSNVSGARYQVNGSGTLPGTGMDNAASSAGIQYV